SRALPVVGETTVTVDPRSPAATCLTHAVELMVALVTVLPTLVHPAPGELQVFDVDPVRTSSIVSPTAAPAGTVTDLLVLEPAAECEAPTNWIWRVSEVIDTVWVTLRVAPLLSVTVRVTL